MSDAPEKNYQVGDAAHPRPLDPWFEDEDSAVEYARQLAIVEFHGAFAVWNSNYDIEHLFMNGRRFKPVD